MRAKPDHYSLKAKKEGYPARSVYKLEELDRKTGIIPRSGAVLDVGAAPGSWSLYVLRRTAGRVRLVAVDLKPLGIELPGKSTVVIEGDCFDPEVDRRIAEEAPYDLIMSDAAPATTGNRTVDCGRSFSLVEGILELTPRYLRPGGNFAAKIFQGGRERELLARMQAGFGSCRMIKPNACRNESFETFLIGLDFLGNI